MASKTLRPFLRPFLGRKLPRHLRARAIGKTAETLPGGLADPRFPALLEAIDSSSFHWDQSVTIYTAGRDALSAMRRAIDDAQNEILLEAYIWHDDETGHAIAEGLIEADRRGVTVKVLADAFGSGRTKASFWRRLERRGIEVRLFNPLFSRFSKLWNPGYRDHRKILVVDRQRAFTGGMNIGTEYGRIEESEEDRKSVWRDTHLQIEGDVAWEMAIVFAEGWRQAGGSLRLEALRADEEERLQPGALVLDSQPYRGSRETAAVLAAITGASRKRLWVTNAYFAPLPMTLQVLRRAAERGVDVRLLLPGITDVPLVRHAGHGSFSYLLKAGVRIFEYQPAVLHAKTLVADSRVSVVGSTNLDFRSFHFNAECNLVLLDESSSAHLEAAFEEDLRHSEEIDPERWHRRALRHRCLDQAARCLGPLL